jgi:hypothetical protein
MGRPRVIVTTSAVPMFAPRSYSWAMTIFGGVIVYFAG